MYSSLHQPNALRARALLFTSLLTAAIIAAAALITLYNPPVAQAREEMLLLDLSMVPPSMETPPQMSENKAALSQAAGQTTGHSSQNIHNASQTTATLPPDNTEALFPGMHSDENGTGKEGNKNPLPGEPGTGEHPGLHDSGGTDMYNLSGRDCLLKPQLSSAINEEGKVQVSIWVDEKGQVSRAIIDEKNTNTSSRFLRKTALQNALKTKWSEKSGAPEQRGFIAYKFVLK